MQIKGGNTSNNMEQLKNCFLKLSLAVLLQWMALKLGFHSHITDSVTWEMNSVLKNSGSGGKYLMVPQQSLFTQELVLLSLTPLMPCPGATLTLCVVEFTWNDLKTGTVLVCVPSL